MTIRYVSKTGDNSDGLSLATAYNELLPAYNDAVSGDTILFDDGVYNGVELKCGGATNYILMQKGITLEAINPYAVYFVADNTDNLLRVHGDLSGETFTIGKIKINGAGGSFICKYPIRITQTSASLCNVNIHGTHIEDSSLYFIHSLSNNVNFNISDVIIDENNGRDSIYIQSLSNGSITIKDSLIQSTDKENITYSCISLVLADSSVIVEIDNVTINRTSSATSASGATSGIRVRNTDNVVIKNCNITITAVNPSQSIQGVSVSSDSLTLTANNSKIHNNTFTLDSTNSGAFVWVGTDGTTTGDGNHSGEIYNNIGTGGLSFSNTGGHGFCIGHAIDSKIYGNIVETIAIGVLIKDSTNCYAFSNLVKLAITKALYFKGAIDSNMSNNTVTMSGGSSGTYGINAGPDTIEIIDCSNCSFNNNIIQVIADTLGRIIEVFDDNQDVILTNNNYFIANNASVPSIIVKYKSNTYQTLNSYAVAHEPTANLDDPKLDASFKLLPNSPVKDIGITWWDTTGRRPLDAVGYPYPDTQISLGAYQTAIELNYGMVLEVDGATQGGPYVAIPAGEITVSEDHYALHAKEADKIQAIIPPGTNIITVGVGTDG